MQVAQQSQPGACAELGRSHALRALLLEGEVRAGGFFKGFIKLSCNATTHLLDKGGDFGVLLSTHLKVALAPWVPSLFPCKGEVRNFSIWIGVYKAGAKPWSAAEVDKELANELALGFLSAALRE